MWSGSKGVGVARAVEHVKVGVEWVLAMKRGVWGDLVEGLSGKEVNDMCGCVKTVDPDMESTDDIVDGAEGTLGFAIVWGSDGHDMRKWISLVRKNERGEELSNSLSLSHCTFLMVQPNSVATKAIKLESVEKVSDLKRRGIRGNENNHQE